MLQFFQSNKKKILFTTLIYPTIYNRNIRNITKKDFWKKSNGRMTGFIQLNFRFGIGIYC